MLWLISVHFTASRLRLNNTWHVQCHAMFLLLHAVPAPNCESVQLRDGKLVVSWDFTHTGDLPLTRVLVTYTYRNGEESITNTATDIQNLTTASVEVNNIVAGITYTFSINATNSRGSKVVNCDSVTIGKLPYYMKFDT